MQLRNGLCAWVLVRRALRTSALALCLAACAGADPQPASIGAVLVRDGVTGAVRVQETARDDALEDALLPGDQLVLVEGRDVASLSSEELRAALRGPEGTSVRVTVLRGASVVRLSIPRTPLGAAKTPRPTQERLEE